VCEYGATEVAVQLGGGALFAKFSRDDELEADLEGIRFVVGAKIDPRGIPEMFRILVKERDSNAASSGLDAWFRTHPLEEDRIKASEQAIARYSARELAALTQDSPRYQSFRARLASLPAVAATRQ
jgi:predicted Zn-dependent protease